MDRQVALGLLLLFHMEWTYGDQYVFRVVDQFEEPLFTELLEKTFFDEFPSINYRALMSEAEIQRDKDLRKRLNGKFSLRIAVYSHDGLVGWTSGWQDTDGFFYMGTSAVLPEHRKRGIYSELLSAVLRLTESEGFPVVHSKHLACNNAVIIPKLKCGFVISGVELLECFGLIVKMTYFHDSRRRDIYNYRAGFSRPTEEIRKALKF